MTIQAEAVFLFEMEPGTEAIAGDTQRNQCPHCKYNMSPQVQCGKLPCQMCHRLHKALGNDL